MNIGLTLVLVVAIGAVATIVTDDVEVFEAAIGLDVMIGIGYLVAKMLGVL